MKIGKKDCGQYSLRGITLGQKGNFCGYIDVEGKCIKVVCGDKNYIIVKVD